MCRDPVPDNWHCFWTCPSLNDSGDEIIIDTQKFQIDLKDEYVHYYDRFLITSDLAQLDSAFDPLAESPRFSTTSRPIGVPEVWPSGHYFGDGSGGTYS